MSDTSRNALDRTTAEPVVANGAGEDEEDKVLPDGDEERLPLTALDDAQEGLVVDAAASSAPKENGGSHLENEDENQDATLDKKKKMETFEIEDGTTEGDAGAPHILDQISQDVDDLDEEAQGLLAEGPPAEQQAGGRKMYCCFCIGPLERLGSCTIFFPASFASSGWGIMGPHWFGPPCVLGVLLSACSYFIQHAFHKIGPITGYICILWTTGIVYLLANVAYRDPGIVRQTQEAPTKNHRWCELCKNYQPPKGAHCPDCNVCVAGFDQYVYSFLQKRRKQFLSSIHDIYLKNRKPTHAHALFFSKPFYKTLLQPLRMDGLLYWQVQFSPIQSIQYCLAFISGLLHCMGFFARSHHFLSQKALAVSIPTKVK